GRLDPPEVRPPLRLLQGTRELSGPVVARGEVDVAVCSRHDPRVDLLLPLPVSEQPRPPELADRVTMLDHHPHLPIEFVESRRPVQVRSLALLAVASGDSEPDVALRVDAAGAAYVHRAGKLGDRDGCQRGSRRWIARRGGEPRS